MSEPIKMRMCRCVGCGEIKLCYPSGICQKCLNKYAKEVKKDE